jgi:hypothetical protein
MNPKIAMNTQPMIYIRLRPAMQQTMQRHCAVFRDGPLLEAGFAQARRHHRNDVR